MCVDLSSPYRHKTKHTRTKEEWQKERKRDHIHITMFIPPVIISRTETLRWMREVFLPFKTKHLSSVVIRNLFIYLYIYFFFLLIFRVCVYLKLFFWGLCFCFFLSKVGYVCLLVCLVFWGHLFFHRFLNIFFHNMFSII